MPENHKVSDIIKQALQIKQPKGKQQMVFDRKLSEKSIHQLCGVMTEMLADALRDYRQECVDVSEWKTSELTGIIYRY